jgi:hypothetical protein
MEMSEIPSEYHAADFLQCLIARHYEREHGPAEVMVGFVLRWDIRFSDGVTAEVKCDTLAARTYKAAIEFWFNGRPSGILESEAKLWIHCVPEGRALRCYELDRRHLLRLCIECGEVKPGGDYSSSLLKLIPLQEIRKISNRDFLLEDVFVREILSHAYETI